MQSVWEIAERCRQPVEVVVFQAVHLGMWNEEGLLTNEDAETIGQILHQHDPTVFQGTSSVRRWKDADTVLLKAEAAGALLRSDLAPADLAQLTGVAPQACRTVLDQLVDEGMVSIVGDRYAAVGSRRIHLKQLAGDLG